MTDITTFGWRVEQGDRETLTFPVLDGAQSVDLTGWDVDAVIKTRPGGAVLHTFPPEHITADADGITLVIPAAVSAEWTWTAGWFRVKILDPATAGDDPNWQRVLHGPVIVELD